MNLTERILMESNNNDDIKENVKSAMNAYIEHSRKGAKVFIPDADKVLDVCAAVAQFEDSTTANLADDAKYHAAQVLSLYFGLKAKIEFKVEVVVVLKGDRKSN